MSFNINYSEITQIYRDGIDSVIEGVGKTCRLFYPETITTTDNDSYDPLRPDQNIYPDWGSNDSKSRAYEDIKCLVHYSPKRFKDNGENALTSSNVIEIKTYATNLKKINQAEYIVPDWSETNLDYSEYRLIRQPKPHGMGTIRYIISYWERV